MTRAHRTLGVICLAYAGIAWAGEGSVDEPVHIVDNAKATCNAKGGVCLKPGAHTAYANDAKTAKFQRAASVAAAGGHSAHANANQPWTLELSAQLKRPAVAGNTLFVFFDMADPNAIKENSSTALFQTSVKAGKALAAHLTLNPEDGFNPGHTYRLRIVQLLNKREVLLAEGDFSLL